MKREIKRLSFINIIGFTLISVVLVCFVLINPFNWADLLIGVNLITSAPFLIAGIISLNNIERPHENQVQKVLLVVFLMLILPSIVLPFAYGLGGLIIFLAILALGLWGIIKIKSPMTKLQFINRIGFFFLVLNLLVLINLITELT